MRSTLVSKAFNISLKQRPISFLEILLIAQISVDKRETEVSGSVSYPVFCYVDLFLFKTTTLRQTSLLPSNLDILLGQLKNYRHCWAEHLKISRIPKEDNLEWYTRILITFLTNFEFHLIFLLEFAAFCTCFMLNGSYPQNLGFWNFRKLFPGNLHSSLLSFFWWSNGNPEFLVQVHVQCTTIDLSKL